MAAPLEKPQVSVADEKVGYLHQVEQVTKEEQQESVLSVVRQHPYVALWCLYYSFAAIGW
jgi:hypothetical protein